MASLGTVLVRSIVGLSLGGGIALLLGCTSPSLRADGGGLAGESGANHGGAGGASTDTGGESGTTGAGGGDGTIVGCDAPVLICRPGHICVPDPRTPCVPGEACSHICVVGSRSCLNVLLSDGGATGECGPNQYVVTCRRSSCEGSNDCLACVDGTATSCDAAAPCPGGQLCIPVRECANGTDCGSICVVPSG